MKGAQVVTTKCASALCQALAQGREKGTHKTGEIPWIIGFVGTEEHNGDKLLLLGGPKRGVTGGIRKREKVRG